MIIVLSIWMGFGVVAMINMPQYKIVRSTAVNHFTNDVY